MTNIYLLKYNNYYNRIVKKPYTTIGEYLDTHEYEAFFGINFIPNDGVTTTHIFNFTPRYDFVPDYLIAEDTETGLYTKWYIVEQVRTLKGQYKMNLVRDVLSDFYEETKEATTFINKGFVTSENPLIFNKEGIAVNQIKKQEILLKDSTRAAWIVGYLAPNLAAEGDVTVNVSYEQDVIPDISEFEYPEYIGQEIYGSLNLEKSFYRLYSKDAVDFRTYYAVLRYLNNKGQYNTTETIPTSSDLRVTNLNKEQLALVNLPISDSVFDTLLYPRLNSSDLTELLKLRNKIYKDGNTYKKIVFKEISDSQLAISVSVSSSVYPNVYQAITQALTNAGVTYTEGRLVFGLFAQKYQLTFEEVGSPFTEADITFKSTIKLLKDAPYKMFAIPVSDNAILRVGTTDIYTNKDRMLQIASSIATGLKTAADGFLYDIQLLPYCPFEDKFMQTLDKNGIEYIGAGQEHKDFDIVRDSSDSIIAYLFYADRSSFTTNVTAVGTSLYPTLDYNNPTEFKTKNETYMFRIVAPNFANFEDFNYFKNYGVNYFNVDCTYKPFTPYIKININYKGLYGQDFNDQRGLILGGDYSLPVISDNWINYQIQNKNYANIFERENQNIEYKHKWNMASTVTGAAVGTMQGAFMGGMLGGPGGAIAGGIGAGITGALDIGRAAATHAEDMDYRKDMFNFNISNIQALPQGLVKTSALNYNSKIYPFVEIYGCTEEETEVVRNKIKFDGMTLNVLGSIKDYLNPSDMTYIQGRVVRISINEDSHMANAINSELNKGVYYE